jgi:dTDP-4-dehydrorhamnose 3,5-epimerase-like enzyme
MNNDDFTSMVDRGEWPARIDVPLDAPFRNQNGVIQNLVLKPMTSVAAITSRKGAVRANHYHKTDWHYAYVVSGAIAYFERAVDSSEIPKPTIFKTGSMFFTPPMREHSMVFLEDTIIITMAKNIRSHENHESDVVRVSFIDPSLADEAVQNWELSGETI